ncbi:unnamed protein product [Rodentolepis nana]|uniref:KxDL domain-containing protein n=1 Tax=Rodentolepis nana TaxID=102285 RepID=A0A0R3T3B2_RODNA|nr:unnamed protein product [Rodentolepis nana]
MTNVSQDLDKITPGCRAFENILCEQGISKIISQQKSLLSRLEKTNAMLQTVNELSSQRSESLTSQLRSYGRMLVSTKRELNTILKRVDSIQKILKRKYPSEYQQEANAIEAAWKAELESELEMAYPSPRNSAPISRAMETLPDRICSGLFSDLKYCHQLSCELIEEVLRLSRDSKKASYILKLVCVVFMSFISAKVFCYLSNSIALTSFADLILFDVLYLLVALMSIWVKQQSADVKTYCFGYERFEVISVFAATILSILSSFYLLKEAIERLFEPDVVVVEYMPLTALLCFSFHVVTIYLVDNPAFTHVTQACVSSWLQEQVADISRSLRSSIPSLSRILPPRMNPIALVGSIIFLVTMVTYVLIDPSSEAGTFPDTVAAVIISLLLFNTMVPMAVYSGKILLQTTPSYLVTALDKALREASTLEGVLELRNEHFWTIGFGALVGSLYVRVRRDASEQLVLAHVTRRLHPFVKHLTIQVMKDDWTRSTVNVNFDWPPPSGYMQNSVLLQGPSNYASGSRHNHADANHGHAH